MAYSVVVAGGSLYRVSAAGVATALALPTGVTLSLSRVPRFVIFGRDVILTNNPRRSLIIDPSYTVRPLQLVAPVSPPIVAAGASGGLTGAYSVKYTHIVLDPDTGALLAESDFSPVSATVSLTAKLLTVSGVSASPDAAVTHHRLYRTLAAGSVYYQWIDIEASKTGVSDDRSDILLPNLSAPRELGAGPGLFPSSYMTLVVAWKNRLWGVGNRDLDTVRYSGEGLTYGWPATYGLDIQPIGADAIGITGLMARRDMLGVAKRESFSKISGGLPDGDGVPQWDVQIEKEGKGCYGPSLVVDDTAYYLGPDGVYSWGASGFACPSDGRTRKWFATDDYFNRALFPRAFAKYNQKYDTIEWHLASAGSNVIDAWVSLDRATGSWFGPHLTNKAGPTAGFTLVDSADQSIPVIGADNGVIYLQNQPGFSDAGVAIPVDLISKHHDGNTPGISKVFGSLGLESKALPGVGNCQVLYRVGALNDDPTQTLQPVTQTVAADMREGSQDLPRMGVGQVAQIEITESTNGAECQLYGYEIPYYELGDRARH